MPHEDIVSQNQGKRRREAPFKRHRAWMPFDADPDNYHNLGVSSLWHRQTKPEQERNAACQGRERYNTDS